ncbi:PEP-CTERM sorting domain-containing protein [Paludibaculum fermentans]|uniref:PEP-CTERM sorting domain-containing protein n=1 Tax=Paludibaculum fermentans TaxID=1473598 RepID=A0A7S7NRD5_PALFE|nr:PEP-CTERM sorting domain-containing protein [Paludibaculum fermentans]QOY88412.1 PEP-CTERM sorting domain-containing protein [Paludibaculum fermentans]
MKSKPEVCAAIRRTLAVSALLLVALAWSAPQGKAAVILKIDVVEVSVTSYSPVVVLEGGSLSIVNSTVGNVTGPKIEGSQGFETCFPCYGPTDFVSNIHIVATNDAGNSGTFTGNLPVKWDFDLSQGLGAGQVSALGSSSLEWSLQYLVTSLADSTEFTFQTSGSGFGNFSGTGEITGLAGVTPAVWAITLDILWQTNSNGAQLVLDIPDKSLAMPGALASVPEPGTYLLMGAGLAAVAGLRRFRR